MKTLAQHNADKLKEHIEANTYPKLNNIACPECGCELMDGDDRFSMSDPPKRNIKCSRCSYVGYRLA